MLALKGAPLSEDGIARVSVLFPNKKWQSLCTRAVDAISTVWCDVNNFYVDKIQKLHWEITGLENLSRKDWYLVVANHQSWLDIVILQRLFNKKIPVLKFFVKVYYS